MSVVAQSLLSNESVVLEARKHPIAPVRKSAAPALMVLGGLLLWSWDPSGDGILGLLGSIVAILRWTLLIGGVAWIAYAIVAWRRAEFAVTTLRVLRYEGLLQRRSSETLLSEVRDVMVVADPLDRALGCGDLRIITRPGYPDVDDFRTITGATRFRDAIRMGIGPAGQTGGPTGGRAATAQAPGSAPAARPAPVAHPASAATPAPGAPGARAAGAPFPSEEQAARLVRLAELRDRGVITPEEFAAKKAEILARI
jgi:hypothetical protein